MQRNERILNAISTLMKVFHEYASKDSLECKDKDASKDRLKLSKHEFKELLQKDFDFDIAKDPAKIEEMMKKLDEDGDKQLNFKEFVDFVVTISCAFNELYEDAAPEEQTGSE